MHKINKIIIITKCLIKKNAFFFLSSFCDFEYNSNKNRNKGKNNKKKEDKNALKMENMGFKPEWLH